MIAVVVAVIVIISSLVQLGYCFYFFRRSFQSGNKEGTVAVHRAMIPEHAKLSISVIICAKNEAENLAQNLPFVLAQNYHNEHGNRLFEVIVVNDQSTDHSAKILLDLQQEYSHLKVVNIDPQEMRTLPGKKFALSKAIAIASHDYCLMTDADCKPASKAWITWMAFPFLKGKEIVAGYGGFYESGSLLNLFIRCETLHTYLQYKTYNLAGFPYMAVGRNLACKKSLLQHAQQDKLWAKTASGDDDLLINICATKDNMVVNTYPASFTYSHAKSTFNSWVKQKQRHFSTGKLYRKSAQYFLGVYALSHALFWCALPLIFVFPPSERLLQLAFGVAMLRCVVFWTVFSELTDNMDSRRIKFFLPIFDVLWLFYNLIFAPFIFWKNKQQWK